MLIDDKTRKKLIVALKGTNYRKVVSERAACHPNTVSNILKEAPQDPTEKTEIVELALLEFAKEVLEKKGANSEERAERIRKAKAIAKQL